ncbi:MAG: SH3 domain-containing protein [Boseongicola sp.]|nr:MAG: SH3 domain-containing protein [Boseongicola sp.]
MFKLIAVTLAVIYAVFMVFGDGPKAERVTRDAREPLFNFSLASFTTPEEQVETQTLAPLPTVSESDAVAAALEAGKTLRATRDNGEVLQSITTAEKVQPTQQQPSDLWYVSGAKVNLRSGPGTGNAVVAQLTQGTKAEALTDTGSDWIEIRTTDGTAGWIFGKFLSDQPPA